MGSRERKRQQRRKRKRRSVERPAAEAPAAEDAPAENGTAGADENGGAATEPGENFQQRMSRRSDERNQAVRESLEPLPQGDRPGAVTVSAVISALLALIFTVSAVIAAVTSVEVRGETQDPAPLVLFAILLWVMTYGLWRARYWAVIGFQMLLVLFMLSSALGLLAVGNVLQALGTLTLLAGSSTLFYFMIRAMARIQMPDRPTGPAGPGQR